MTVKTMQQRISARLFAAVLLATCVFTVAAYSQPTFVGKFTLPYEVHWNHDVLPPGEYKIQMNSNGTPALVYSANSNKSVFTAIPIIADCEKGGTFLTVTAHGHELRVRSLNVPWFGKSLIFEPLTRAEREMLVKAGQIDVVPVVSVRK